MFAYAGYFAFVQHDDHIGVSDRRYALSYDDLRRSFQFFAERFSDLRFGRRINGARRIVQYQYFRLFQECSGNAQALLLSAGNVCAALVKLCFVSFRKRADKFVCLRV